MKRYLNFPHRRFANSLVAVATLAQISACGNWVGNPTVEDVEEEPATLPAPLEGLDISLADRGEALLHGLKLTAGQPVKLGYEIAPRAGLIENSDQTAFEISIVDAQGEEQAYTRKAGGSSEIDFIPKEDGEYTVVIKNNSSESSEVVIASTEGASEDQGMINSKDDTQAPHKNISLKAVIVLARTCKVYTNGGQSTQTFTAPEGSVYIQPFVFLGEVNSKTQSVQPLSQASIRIVSGDTVLPLMTLGSLDLAVYRQVSGLTKAEHETYTRTFYSAYFGAAGEMYTTDTFRFGGNCATAPTFALPKDPGAADLRLEVVDATHSIDESFPIRPTVAPAFSMYDRADSKLDNWDPCSYDTFTAIPKNANDGTVCRQLSRQDPPYLMLDDRMPSEQKPEQLTKLSDPTRILYYGHSLSRAFKQAVIDQQESLRGQSSRIDLDHCLANGGMRAVPLSQEQTYLPLGEFNTQDGDLIQLARRAGSYTALKDFHQGNVSIAGSLSYPTCIPNTTTGESCASYKVLKVDVKDCSLAADSGISTTAVGESFIYPEYFELSGEIVE